VWSEWSAYTSASDISTTGKTDVEIRTKRKGTECSDASWSTVSWVVEQTPVTGTLAKSPDQATVCEGTDVAATLTAGSGGAGVDSTYSRTKASSVWSAWTAYTSASNISTTGKTDVEIRTKRKGTECSDASWSTVSWVVEQTPVTGTLTKSPNQATVCQGANVSATLTAGSGGSGVDSTYSRTKASSVWSAWTAYTSASNISTTGKTDVEIRTKRKGTECSDASWTTVSWVVEQTPVTGTLAKSPDLPHVCEGTDVAATLTAGSGGAGVDSTYSRTKASSVWSAWSAYTSASDISTTGKTDVEIRTKRKGTECSDASWTTVSWEVEQTPVTGTLARDPNVSNVCEGTQLSAALTSGAGGNGTDELELRSHDGVSWTSWDTYTSGADFSSADKIQVQIRTRRSASYCSPSDYDTVFWLVDSTTVGGEVTGGTEVCYGSNSTLLTLEDQVGAVQKWQYSTDGLIWQDMTHTSTQYTATDLIVDTWYRAVVKSGECLTEISDSTLITIFADFHISGYAKYQNNPMTPLDGLKITLKKEGTQLGEPVITGPTGYYDFSGLVNGDYALEVSSAHPSGLWQTWGGVNNTDYLLVSRHIAGTQLLQIDPPVVRVTASTKLPHPAINNSDATAIRQAAKYPLTGYTFFDIPKWVFSGTTTLTPISAFTLNCASVTRDIRGLCAGDVNGTYIPPSGNKNLEANLELIHRGRLPVSDEMIFPVQAEMDMEIGAITLMLSFDAANLMITSVDMPGSHQEAPWFRVEGNTLYIGWMSLDAIRVARGETLLRIHGIKTGAAQVASATSHEEPVIRFTLQQNPLCELADATGEVLYYAKLAIADAGPVTAGYDEIVVSFYPNPAADVLNIETIMPVEGQFKADLITVTGSVAGHLQERILKAGLNKLTLDISNLPNGAYLLRVVAGDQTKTMKVIVNQ
jgi:ribosomal protein S8E